MRIIKVTSCENCPYLTYDSSGRENFYCQKAFKILAYEGFITEGRMFFQMKKQYGIVVKFRNGVRWRSNHENYKGCVLSGLSVLSI
jgi:hypothetical protein